jgi:para-nitrobenzyl esterase
MANTVVARAPVWRYLYTHTIENDPFLAQFRASHVFEEQLLWGADVFSSGYLLSPAEQILSQQLIGYWTNFAKTGNPNGSGLPSWPKYDSTNEPTMTLDDTIGSTTNYHDQQCALLDTIPEPFPLPWEGHGKGPTKFPPGFLLGHSKAP